MNNRFFLEIAYKGTNYHGWQIQPNALSVQEVIAQTISSLLNESVAVTGCGRTDTGVHASQYFLHFETGKSLPEPFVTRLNKILPVDIVVKKLFTNLPTDAHARFDATYRAYDYYIHFDKNPFLHEVSWHYPYFPLNVDKMQQAAALLPLYEDFLMFCKTGGNQKTTLCQVFKSELFFSEQDNSIRYHVAANRFLRSMVRRIVGSLINVGKNKISLDEFKLVLDTKGVFKYNDTVPPQGLFLSEVRYSFINE